MKLWNITKRIPLLWWHFQHCRAKALLTDLRDEGLENWRFPSHCNSQENAIWQGSLQCIQQKETLCASLTWPSSRHSNHLVLTWFLYHAGRKESIHRTGIGIQLLGQCVSAQNSLYYPGPLTTSLTRAPLWHCSLQLRNTNKGALGQGNTAADSFSPRATELAQAPKPHFLCSITLQTGTASGVTF